jgi:hypothetical protein
VPPRRRGQLAAQHLGHVDLHDDLLVEIAPGVEVEVGVGALAKQYEQAWLHPR